MKIQIIGHSGSGKSTLAKKLGEHYNIPVLYLDNTRYYGDWESRSLEEQQILVEDFLSKNESWVIDGNHSKVCPNRFLESDMTIYLDMNRFVCLFSAYKRHLKYKNKQRESCKCNGDKFDLRFFNWILFRGRTKERIKNINNLLNMSSGEKYRFTSRRQVNKFLNKLGVLVDKK